MNSREDSYSTMSRHSNEFYDDYFPDLCGLTITDIITQDDPPRELYMYTDLLDVTEDEYILSILFSEDCEGFVYIEGHGFYSDCTDDFDYYDHFGIDSSDSNSEGALEAAVSGYSN